MKKAIFTNKIKSPKSLYFCVNINYDAFEKSIIMGLVTLVFALCFVGFFFFLGRMIDGKFFVNFFFWSICTFVIGWMIYVGKTKISWEKALLSK
jgi:hypothetical protein